MCFSAAASFSAGISLGIISVASLSKVREPHQYVFAGIPVIFAVQQFVEGVVWLSMSNSSWDGYQSSASLIYLLFAQVIWPLWLPLAFLLYERDANRKKVLRLFLLPGLLISVYFFICLLSCQREVNVVNHHIFYKIDFPSKLIPFAAFLYLLSTVIPPLLSKNMLIKLMGIIILASYIVSRIFFQPSLISVWCFFAIAIGVLVYLVMRNDKTISVPS